MTNEQRQFHYEYCVSKGVPEVLAACIASQVDNWVYKPNDSTFHLVYGFKYWPDSVEGFAFWDAVSNCDECQL
jgi:hypothetical protein